MDEESDIGDLKMQGVFSVGKRGLKLEEIPDGVTIQQIVESTGCDFEIANPLLPMKQVPRPMVEAARAAKPPLMYFKPGEYR